jgi:hypothetical protein
MTVFRPKKRPETGATRSGLITHREEDELLDDLIGGSPACLSGDSRVCLSGFDLGCKDH